jgi:hypothetical protein
MRASLPIDETVKRIITVVTVIVFAVFVLFWLLDHVPLKGI